MKLNIKGRENLRKYIEEILIKIPEGKKVHIDKEILEILLFEKVIVNKKTKEFFNIPIWSGNFLSKIDLSEISFENVSWSLLGETEENRKEKTQKIKDFINKTENEKTIKDLKKETKNKRTIRKKERKKNYINEEENKTNSYYRKFVNYSNTNAKIDFKKSIEYKVFKKVEINYCDFSKTDLSNNEIDQYSLNNSYLDNTGIKFNKLNLEEIKDTRITDLDLSNFSLSIIDVLILFKNKKYNETANLKNTKIKIYYDRRHPIYTLYEIEKIIKYGKLNGCTINGEKIENNKIIKPKTNPKQLILKRLKSTN